MRSFFAVLITACFVANALHAADEDIPAKVKVSDAEAVDAAAKALNELGEEDRIKVLGDFVGQLNDATKTGLANTLEDQGVLDSCFTDYLGFSKGSIEDVLTKRNGQAGGEWQFYWDGLTPPGSKKKVTDNLRREFQAGGLQKFILPENAGKEDRARLKRLMGTKYKIQLRWVLNFGHEINALQTLLPVLDLGGNKAGPFGLSPEFRGLYLKKEGANTLSRAIGLEAK